MSLVDRILSRFRPKAEAEVSSANIRRGDGVWQALTGGSKGAPGLPTALRHAPTGDLDIGQKTGTGRTNRGRDQIKPWPKAGADQIGRGKVQSSGQSLAHSQGRLALFNAQGIHPAQRPGGPATERVAAGERTPWEWEIYRPEPGSAAAQAVTRVPRGGATAR